MPRQLVSLRQLIKDTEEQGNDPDDLYIDPDDVVELEENPDDSED